MTVGELKAALEDFGDHVEVMLDVGGPRDELLVPLAVISTITRPTGVYVLLETD